MSVVTHTSTVRYADFTPRYYERSTDWVSAQPFNAHVRHLMTTTGMPWRVLARAATVPSGVVRDLLGHAGRPRAMRRIRARDAYRLLTLTPATLRAMRATPDDGVQARRAVTALLAIGHSHERVAHWLGLNIEQLIALLRGERGANGLVTCCALAACEAWGILLDGISEDTPADEASAGTDEIDEEDFGSWMEDLAA